MKVAQGGMVVGMLFNSFEDQTFNSLGYIDVNDAATNHNYFLNSDGLHGSYTVGIWLASTQQLLASTVVTPDSTLMGSFRYAPIPTTVIPAGQSFMIGVVLPENLQDPWLGNILPSNRPGVTGLASGRFHIGASLQYPDQVLMVEGQIYGYGIVNGSSVAVVPEPSSMACLLAGLGGFTLFRRRFRAQAKAA